MSLKKIGMAFVFLGCSTPLERLYYQHDRVSQQQQMGYVIGDGSTRQINQHKNAFQLFVPASCLKVLTGSAALFELGPQFRFETKLLYDAKAKEAYVIFGADPTLTTLELKTLLFDFILQHKPKKLVWVNPAQRLLPYNPAWLLEDIEKNYIAPLSFAALDGNQKWSVSAGKTHPQWMQDNLNALFQKLKKPPKVEMKSLKDATQKTSTKWVKSHFSRPLHEILSEALKNSNNFVFEQIYAYLAFRRLGEDFSFIQAGEVVKGLLAEHFEVDMSRVRMVDGSGLSRKNLISPWDLQQVLLHEISNPWFVQSLAISGVDGTLKHRQKRIVGKVQGKTGAMTGISCLCGYARLPKGFKVFTFMFQNLDMSMQKAQQIQDDFLEDWVFHETKGIE